MPHSLNNLRNIILCDDARTETGNKVSLMGVMAGDIVVAETPATINLAVFMQYFVPVEETGKVSLEVRLLQGDLEMAKGKFEAEIPEEKFLTFVLPRALVTFEKETTFKIRASINGNTEQEILSRKIIRGITS